MAFKYLAVAALAAGSTYGALTMRPDAEPIVQLCTYETLDGERLEVEDGPLGPRLGGLDYIGSNLTHEEKIRIVASDAFDAPGVLETMFTDLVRNHENVTDDIYRSIRAAIEEAF